MAVGAGGADPRVAQIARLFEHLAWADALLATAVSAPGASPEAIREYAHVAGAGEAWLSRIEHRTSSAAIWPSLSAAEAAELTRKTADGFRVVIGGLHDDSLDLPVTYTNSAGKTFDTPLGDILIHIAMHGQYHRGKVNVLLRQSGVDPAPVDFIGFVRGVPAATQLVTGTG